MMCDPVQPADPAWSAIGTAMARCLAILAAGPPGSEIADDDADFVDALFWTRTDPLLDLWDHQVIRYLRDWRSHEADPDTGGMSFWAELDDGTRIEFSHTAALRQLAGGRCP